MKNTSNDLLAMAFVEAGSENVQQVERSVTPDCATTECGAIIVEEKDWDGDLLVTVAWWFDNTCVMSSSLEENTFECAYEAYKSVNKL